MLLLVALVRVRVIAFADYSVWRCLAEREAHPALVCGIYFSRDEDAETGRWARLGPSVH